MGIEDGIQQLNDEGRLGPIQDLCVTAARRAFMARKDKDTHPQIVQLILHGELQYRGPVDEAPLDYMDLELMSLTMS